MTRFKVASHAQLPSQSHIWYLRSELDQAMRSAIRDYLFDVSPGQAATMGAGFSGTRRKQLIDAKGL